MASVSDPLWSPDLEQQLALFTRKYLFDFQKVASSLQDYAAQEGVGDTSAFTADACRLRFAVLDLTHLESDASSKPASETTGKRVAAAPRNPTQQVKTASTENLVGQAMRRAERIVSSSGITPQSLLRGNSVPTVEEFTAAVFESDAPPSDFSIFTHSLKDRFDAIFADVRSRLPAVAPTVSSSSELEGMRSSQESSSDEDAVLPLDIKQAKAAMLAPLVATMQLIAPEDAARMLSQMSDSEESDDGAHAPGRTLDGRTRARRRHRNPDSSSEGVLEQRSGGASAQGGVLNLEMLSGIDLDALLHSLERGSHL